MGKVRRYRQKYHLGRFGPPKPKPTETKEIIVTKTESTIIEKNVFEGVDIAYESLTKTLIQDIDIQSVTTTKSRKELKLEEQHLKKKEKKRLRHERFLQKLDVAQEAMKADKKGGKKNEEFFEYSVEMGMEAIFPWTPFFNSGHPNDESKNKPKGILKMKKRIKQQTKDAKQMRRIVNDKRFRLNPGETIIDYLKRKVESRV